MENYSLHERRAGILMPIFSLPGKYGIGSFSKEAREFVHFLKKAGQSYWQILPMGPTGYGDSPYQSFSTFAGNPYFIDLDTLLSEGLLKKEELEGLSFSDLEDRVDYGKLYTLRFPVLDKAVRRFLERIEKAEGKNINFSWKKTRIGFRLMPRLWQRRCPTLPYFMRSVSSSSSGSGWR